MIIDYLVQLGRHSMDGTTVLDCYAELCRERLKRKSGLRSVGDGRCLLKEVYIG